MRVHPDMQRSGQRCDDDRFRYPRRDESFQLRVGQVVYSPANDCDVRIVQLTPGDGGRMRAVVTGMGFTAVYDAADFEAGVVTETASKGRGGK